MSLKRWLVLAFVLIAAGLLIVRQKRTPLVTSPSASDVTARAEDAAEKHSRARAVEKPASDRSARNAEEPQVSGELARRSLQVRVEDEQRQPIDAARVSTKFKGGESAGFNRSITTTPQGIGDVSVPVQRFERLELVVSRDGYAARKMVWDVTAGDVVPAVWSVTLRKGVQIGGFVVDPDGAPVAGAEVSLVRFWRGGEEWKISGEEPEYPKEALITGADGRWTARNVPAELLRRIAIRANHTNFIGAQVDMDGKPEIEQELRAQTYRLQLTRGWSVHGIVLNTQRQPISGARVWAGRRFTRERQETKSDAEGRFSFRNLDEGKLDFSASADGYAPGGKVHEVKASASELVIELGPGSVIRGTVQDDSKRPIEGARVALEGSPGEDSYDLYEFSTTTDGNGKFKWNGAPNKPMPFYIGKAGYEQRRAVKLKPGEENVVVLNSSREANGLVLDARTAQPVTRFKIALGRNMGKGQFFPNDGRIMEFENEKGMFTVKIDEGNCNAIQARANGYAEQFQILPSAENGEVRVVFNLQPSPALKGMIIGVDGQPGAGVVVALIENSAIGGTIQWARGGFRNPGNRSNVVHTDASGAFEIPSPPESGTVVAGNAEGFGSASVQELRESGKITLLPLGRIEGVLLAGRSPNPGQQLMLTSPRGGIQFDYAATLQTTDGEGRFTFDKVPAGTFHIVRLVRTSGHTSTHSHSTQVEVKPGQATQIILGGAGATIQANVRFETAPSEPDYLVSAQLTTVRPPPPPGLSRDELTALYQSPAWQEQASKMKHYSGAVSADGKLILDSIEPGEYQLKVIALKDNDRTFGMKPFAVGQTTLKIPESAKPNASINVGEVILRAAK